MVESRWWADAPLLSYPPISRLRKVDATVCERHFEPSVLDRIERCRKEGLDVVLENTFY